MAQARQQWEDILATPGDTAIPASAKQGIGIDEILEAIVERVPPPKPTGAASLQALAFDSYFDTYKGVVTHIRVSNGEIRAGMQIKLLHSGKTVEVKEVGSFNPKPYTREKLEVGETGYFTANIKSPREVKVGDTITDEKKPFTLSNYQVPEAAGGYCKRGGRFGAHSSSENQPPMYNKRVLFYAWFNAGVRAVDIRDPFNPKEIGYYIPAISDNTDKRCIPTPQGAQCKVAIQSNNADVDDRGYIYVVDRADTGMHILELTGSARDAAKFDK